MSAIENERLRYALRGFTHRIVRDMGVAHYRLIAGVPKKFADHFQRLSVRQRVRGESVAEIVNSHTVQVGCLCILSRPRATYLLLGTKGGLSHMWLSP